MKAITRIFFVLSFTFLMGIFITSEIYSQQQPKGKQLNRGFVDLNGDGINDNAVDSDGDGIINCLDPDYVRPLDGTGSKLMKGKTYKLGGGGFGPGNGIGNQGIGPKDGTSYGPGGISGICDGTGPQGKFSRAGRK